MIGEKANHQTRFKDGKNSCKSWNVVPTVEPGVTKDELISVSADGSVAISSALGERVRHTPSNDRLREKTGWLEEFTDGLVGRGSKSSGCDPEYPPETPLPNPLLSNRKKGSTHNLFKHFSKKPNCEVCRHMKIFESFLQSESGKRGCPPTERDKIRWYFRTADHKMLNEERESRLHHRHATEEPDWLLNGTRERPSKAYGGRLNQRRSKYGTQTILWNLSKLVKTCFGTIVHRHVTTLHVARLLVQQAQDPWRCCHLVSHLACLHLRLLYLCSLCRLHCYQHFW